MENQIVKADEQKQATPAVIAKQAMEQMQDRFMRVEGVKLQFERELGFALQILRKNTYLMKIATEDKVELQAAIYNVALTGLSLNPVLKYAYLLPRSGKICLEPSYMGLIKVLTDAGSIKQVWADVICEHDYSQIKRGTNPSIEHTYGIEEERGEIVGCYAVAVLANGATQFEVLQLSEVENIKRRSEAVKSGKGSPWDSDEAEMFKKTAIRRLFKYLPKTEIPEQTLQTLEIFDRNNAIENESSKSVAATNQNKEKARLLEFLRDCNTSQYLEGKRAEFEKHGLLEELDNKLAEF